MQYLEHPRNAMEVKVYNFKMYVSGLKNPIDLPVLCKTPCQAWLLAAEEGSRYNSVLEKIEFVRPD